MPWLDTIIVTVIVIVGLFILYRGLKEPIDDLFALIKRGIDAIREKAADKGEDYYETITYG